MPTVEIQRDATRTAAPPREPEEQSLSREPGELDALAVRAAAGDDAAFETLHDQLGERLVGILGRRGALKHSEAEELAQEAWVTVWKLLRAGRFDPRRAAFRSFLVGVAWNLVLRRRRARGRELRALSELALGGPSAGTDDSPAEGALFAELLHGLRGCLHARATPFALEAEERRVIEEASKGRTERALAADLGLAPSSVHARKAKALQKLRRCLTRKGLLERGEP